MSFKETVLKGLIYKINKMLFVEATNGQLFQVKIKLQELL